MWYMSGKEWDKYSGEQQRQIIEQKKQNILDNLEKVGLSYVLTQKQKQMLADEFGTPIIVKKNKRKHERHKPYKTVKQYNIYKSLLKTLGIQSKVDEQLVINLLVLSIRYPYYLLELATHIEKNITNVLQKPLSSEEKAFVYLVSDLIHVIIHNIPQEDNFQMIQNIDFDVLFEHLKKQVFKNSNSFYLFIFYLLLYASYHYDASFVDKLIEDIYYNYEDIHHLLSVIINIPIKEGR